MKKRIKERREDKEIYERKKEENSLLSTHPTSNKLNVTFFVPLLHEFTNHICREVPQEYSYISSAGYM